MSDTTFSDAGLARVLEAVKGKSMSKYEALDKKILNKIGGHPVRFGFIHVRDVREECDRIEKETGRPSFRVLDARLQALRRKGEILATTTGWVRCGSQQ